MMIICQENNCTKSADYGFPNSNIATKCFAHCEENML
jgi:hypothetical protein